MVLKLRVSYTAAFNCCLWIAWYDFLKARYIILYSFHMRCQWRILHISWHDFVSNDKVLCHTGLLEVTFIVRKRRLGLFGHVARLSHAVPANQILRISTKGERWRATVLEMETCLRSTTYHLNPSDLPWLRPCCDTARVSQGHCTGVTATLHGWLRPCSWRRTDSSGTRSQQREASAKHFTLWWWWCGW